MSPRPYRLGQRQAASEQTRARVIAAARELLSAAEGLAGFTVEAVARQANVARMTVYYQFGSKEGLLEALFDDIAARGQIARLAEAFARPAALDALDELIAVFGRFWGSDRLVIRRLRALAALDPDFEKTLQVRDGYRRKAWETIVGRLAEERLLPAAVSAGEAVDVLYTLTSFASFDTLAGKARGPEKVVPLVQRLARAALGLRAQ
jgi:AcrR family transcriptional regulator